MEVLVKTNGGITLKEIKRHTELLRKRQMGKGNTIRNDTACEFHINVLPFLYLSPT